jgi:hypothetical protein
LSKTAFNFPKTVGDSYKFPPLSQAVGRLSEINALWLYLAQIDAFYSEKRRETLRFRAHLDCTHVFSSSLCFSVNGSGRQSCKLAFWAEQFTEAIGIKPARFVSLDVICSSARV